VTGYYCMLFSGKIRVRVMVRFGVLLVSGYAHVFILLSVVIVTVPIHASPGTLAASNAIELLQFPLFVVPEMTNYVSGGTLHLTQSLPLFRLCTSLPCGVCV